MNSDFLVELGTEELPPKALLTLAKAFQKGIESGLKTHKLDFASSDVYAAPRRLAVVVKSLAATTPVEDQIIWGPPAKIAFDDEGNPTKAALAFAQKNGIDPADLATDNDGKVDKLVFRTRVGGDTVETLLETIVDQLLAQLPIPKRMRWGANRHEFVRPVHWLVMLYGNEIIPANIMGLQANRTTRGHRFHYNQTLDIQNASDYAEKLKTHAYVIADFNERQLIIRQQVEAEAAKHGGTAVIDSDLLNEVTALVEWPVALTGRFEERFLSVPAEALISSMKEHQKYFHMVNTDGNLMPYFITVSNIESTDPAQVIDGNERVIRPRLSDAAFFFDTDKKTTLASKREKLKDIVFQAKLGTVFDKTERVAKLAAHIATLIDADATQATRAGELCKADLVSEMVYEFADMQGIAGYYYAKHDGETEAVALAMNEHYQPRFAGDELPASDIGTVVALADRLDTLVGIFGIGEQPTGSKDPFALRRASVGVLRLLVEKNLPLDLQPLLSAAYHSYGSLPEGEAVVQQVLNYMLERFRAWYEEQQIPVAVFQAVSAKALTQPLDIDQRVKAVNYFRTLPEAEALAAANKRVSNLLSKMDKPVGVEINEGLLKESAEQQLAQALKEKLISTAPLLEARNYQAFLTDLASLRDPIDQFFDDVMVMVDDEPLKLNRLAILETLRNLFLKVADISLLAASK